MGGFLPFIPLFAGLLAIGTLAGSAAEVANAVNDAQMVGKKYDEMARHTYDGRDRIAPRSGLYIKPYRKGIGLYLYSHKG